jgi:hypothetical protein
MTARQRGHSASDGSESHNGCSSDLELSTYGHNRNTDSASQAPLSATDSIRRKLYSDAFAHAFWSQVDRSGSCWLWTGQRLSRSSQAYGYLWHAELGKTVHAHRVAWELTHGPIPRGLKVLHRCDNPICCAPSCLWLGTQLDNMRDMAAKGRRSPDAHSPKGRPWSPEQRRKLVALRRLRAAKQIAAREHKEQAS